MGSVTPATFFTATASRTVRCVPPYAPAVVFRRRRVCVLASGLVMRVSCGIGAVGERALLARVRRGWLGDASRLSPAWDVSE